MFDSAELIEVVGGIEQGWVHLPDSARTDDGYCVEIDVKNADLTPFACSRTSPIWATTEPPGASPFMAMIRPREAPSVGLTSSHEISRVILGVEAVAAADRGPQLVVRGNMVVVGLDPDAAGPTDLQGLPEGWPTVPARTSSRRAEEPPGRPSRSPEKARVGDAGFEPVPCAA